MEAPGVEGIWATCLAIFHDSLLSHEETPERITRAVLNLIARARRHSATTPAPVDNTLIARVIRMMADLNLFHTYIETQLLAETRSFYYEESEHIFSSIATPSTSSSSITSPRMNPLSSTTSMPSPRMTPLSSTTGSSSENGIVDVLSGISERIAGEEERTALYLVGNDKTRKEILRAVDEELIKEKLPALLGSEGIAYLIKEHRFSELKQLYTLVKKIGCVSDLKRKFAEFVETYGALLLDFTAPRPSVVQSLIAFRDLLEDVVRGPFEGNESMSVTLRESLERCMDKEQGRIADALALFLDAEIVRAYKEKRSSPQGAASTTVVPSSSSSSSFSMSEFRGTVDKAIALFRMVHGKEVFADSYRGAFARRVLALDRQEYCARARGLEDYVLDKVRDECGTIFTKELDEMAGDVAASRDLTAGYAGRKYPNPCGISMGMLVLSYSYWTKVQEIEDAQAQAQQHMAAVPKEILDLFDTFKTFYATKKDNAKLSLLPGLCTFSLKAKFRAGDKEITSLNLSYVLTFFAFNSVERISIKSLQEKTKIPLRELIDILRCLTSKSIHILNLEVLSSSSSSSSGVSPVEKWKNLDNVISVNNNFAYKKTKLSFKCGDGSGKSAGGKASGASAGVTGARDRSSAISVSEKILAAIARALKKENVLPYSSLVAETQRLLGFNITPADLKKPITELVEKQIIKYVRDTNSYEYVPQ